MLCQNKDCCCSERTVLHQAKTIQQNASTRGTDPSCRVCSRAEKHLIQQITAFNRFGSGSVSALRPRGAWRGPGRSSGPYPRSHTISGTVSDVVNSNSQLGDPGFMITRPGGGFSNLQPLAAVFGCVNRYVSAGNGRSHLHILLFNEHVPLVWL